MNGARRARDALVALAFSTFVGCAGRPLRSTDDGGGTGGVTGTGGVAGASVTGGAGGATGSGGSAGESGGPSAGTVSLPSGAGVGQSAGYRLRVGVGAPGVRGTGASTSYKLRVGQRAR